MSVYARQRAHLVEDTPATPTSSIEPPLSERATFLRRAGARNWAEYVRNAFVFGVVERRRGATGIVLRRIAYPLVLAHANSVIILEDVVIRGAARVHLGRKTAIEQRVILDAKSTDPAGIRLGDGVVVRTGGVIDTGYRGYVHVGARSELGPYAQLRGGGGLFIGEDVLIASNVAIFSTSHDMEAGQLVIQQAVTGKLTTVGDGCWLGANVVVLPGVTVGAGAVVGANSVVTKDVSPGTVVAGAPARFVRERSQA